MPKVPESEWREFMDPDSEKYIPTDAEIKSDRQIEEEVNRHLQNVEFDLEGSRYDPVDEEDEPMQTVEPDALFSALHWLQNDYLNEIKDPTVRIRLEEKISALEQRIYKQYIPFIESQLELFGRTNSPLEKHSSSHRVHSEDVAPYFVSARSEVASLHISDDSRIDFISELDRLQEKFERYRREATLFTFERIATELWKELWFLRENELFSSLASAWETGVVVEKSRIRLEHEISRKKIFLELDLLIAKAHALEEIAGRMMIDDIRTPCIARAKGLRERAEYFKTAAEMPGELFVIEMRLKNVVRRIQSGKEIGADILEKIGQKLSDVKSKRLGIDDRATTDRLTKLFEKVKRMLAGEKIDEDMERFAADVGNIDWAWSLLGVSRDASEKDVRSAYHELALKYHPDRDKSDGATERMQKINEAFEFIRGVKGLK